jgi:hypothetical protein
MILRAELINVLPSGDLEQAGKGSCTYCCTRVEISNELAEVISSWPSLSTRQRQILRLMAAFEKANVTTAAD